MQLKINKPLPNSEFKVILPLNSSQLAKKMSLLLKITTAKETPMLWLNGQDRKQNS